MTHILFVAFIIFIVSVLLYSSISDYLPTKVQTILDTFLKIYISVLFGVAILHYIYILVI